MIDLLPPDDFLYEKDTTGEWCLGICGFAIQETQARILGNSITERNCLAVKINSTYGF